MIDLSSNIRLVDFAHGKRGTQKTEKRSVPEGEAESSATKVSEPYLSDKVVLQFPKGRGTDIMEDTPTRDEANYALESLVRDLPNFRQDLGRVHEFADRRRVLSLLSPLVEE